MIDTVLIVFALLCFLVATFAGGISIGGRSRNLVAAGLFLGLLTSLV